MTLRPTFLARLVFGDWRLRVEDGTIVVVQAGREQRIPLRDINNLAVYSRVVWTELRLDAENFGDLSLHGCSAGSAAMLTDVRQRITSLFRTDLAPTVIALNNFYAQDRYLARHDVDRLILSLAPQYNQCKRISTHPLFDATTKEDRQILTWLRDLQSTERVELCTRNKVYAQREMESFTTFFDKVEKTPLTDEQRRAAVVMEDRNLLIAAAGSGKTSSIVGKIGYAIEKNIYRPTEIIAISFNKAAAKELRDRIQERLVHPYDEEIEAQTFHALGLKFIGQATGRKPSVAEWAKNIGKNINNETDRLILECARKTPEFGILLAVILAVFGRELTQPRSTFKTEKEFRLHQEARGVKDPGRDGIPTIKGDRVRSHEEQIIADMLFYNSVEYEYEKKYAFDVADGEHSQYRPDFYYPSANLYHEHFALNSAGKAPEFMGADEYVKGVEWKRALHKKHGTALMETTSAMFEDGDVLEHLQTELEKHGIAFKPRPYSEILASMTEQRTRPIYTLVGLFLERWKVSLVTDETVHARLREMKGFVGVRAAAFWKAMLLLREFYDRKLNVAQEVDFSDMLIEAAKHLRASEVRHPYRLILVDEFQDISRARAEMLRAMLAQNPECKLFAVGDDWQAIYRFAGADISIMTEFPDEFGATAKGELTRTFRSNQGISDVAAGFIRENSAQYTKTVRATDKARTGAVNIVRYFPNKEDAAVEKTLSEIEAGTTERKSSVYILGRYNYLRPKNSRRWQQRFTALNIEFKTIHGAKGLEADYVVVLGMNAGKSGFPSEKEDDLILGLVTPKKENFKFAEERRLLYVALTRARHKVYLLAEIGSPSSFVTELENKFDDGTVSNRIIDGDGKFAQTEPCPKCEDGVLVERTGRYGNFYGCSNFRFGVCNHTQNKESLEKSGKRNRTSNF